MILTALLAVGLCAPAPAQAGSAEPKGVDLRSVYGGTLGVTKDRPGVPWAVGTGDVWRLRSFRFEAPGDLTIEFGPATLVVGRSRGVGKRPSALWAVVFPDELAAISTELPGGKDLARTVYLRFAPSAIGALFPAETVKGPGDPLALVRAKRIVAHKLRSTFQRARSPYIPTRDITLLDVGTVAGPRRVYLVQGEPPTVHYEKALEHRSLGPLPVEGLDAGDGEAMFQRAWDLFGRHYPYFALRGVDWDELRSRYLPLAARARSPEELAGVLGLLVTELDDLHARVEVGGRPVPTDHGVRGLNGFFPAFRPSLEDVEQRGQVVRGLAEGNIGYLMVDSLTEDASKGESLVRDFDAALEALEDTRGLVLDLRFNGGGNERLGQSIAGRFLSERVEYAGHRYRSGPGRDEFGDVQRRSCAPRGPWRYEGPVLVLQGAMTMSSGEALVLMLRRAPNVTTMGARTAGSSGNPERHDLGHGIVVTVPRWQSLDADGRTFEGVGIAPDVPGEATSAAAFVGADPLFIQAMRWFAAR